MLLSLRKKKGKTFPAVNPAQDGIAKKIVASCIRLQERCAAFMQKQTERFSRNGKLIALFLFCLIAGSMSIYLMAASLMEYRDVPIKILSIKAPLQSGRSAGDNYRSSIVITKQEYQRIEHFRHYMDSLSRTLSGKRVYDSILKQRPGLMDSIAFIENIYQSQIK